MFQVNYVQLDPHPFPLPVRAAGRRSGTEGILMSRDCINEFKIVCPSKYKHLTISGTL